MPKDRKLTYSDRQAQAARDKKQPRKANTPLKESGQKAAPTVKAAK